MKEINKTPYFIHLDVLRFFAAIAVLLFHYHAFLKGAFPENYILKSIAPIFNKGHLGVNLFFVLSSFLITFLTIKEIQQTSTFSIKYFIIRRTLRIWPLYFLVVGISFLIINSFPIYGETTHQPHYFLVFLSNFSEINFGATDHYTQLTIPWSVSIEEQFYLFWAIVIGGFNFIKKNHLIRLFVLLLILSLIFQFFNYDDQRTLYYHTFSAVTDFSIGAISAWLFVHYPAFIKKIVELKKSYIYSIWASIILIFIFKNKIFHYDAFIIFERLIISCCMAWIILRMISDKFIFPIKFKGIAIHLGKASYGIYMYHALILFFVEIIFARYNLEIYYLLIILMLSLVTTILISHLSFKYFESYFLRFKSTFRKIQ